MRQRCARREQLLLVHYAVTRRETRTPGTTPLVHCVIQAWMLGSWWWGRGPMRTRLERQAARLPIDFTGYIGCRDTVATILATADVALAPGPHETFGLAALEALACGTPAVVSRTSALGEILTTDSGAAADDDPQAIAQAVTSIISRPEVLRRTSARRGAEQFTWPRAARAYSERGAQSRRARVRRR